MSQRTLRGGDRPVTAIALDAGFASSQHFATSFRREFRSTPLAWRRADAPTPRSARR